MNVKTHPRGQSTTSQKAAVCTCLTRLVRIHPCTSGLQHQAKPASFCGQHQESAVFLQTFPLASHNLKIKTSKKKCCFSLVRNLIIWCCWLLHRWSFELCFAWLTPFVTQITRGMWSRACSSPPVCPYGLCYYWRCPDSGSSGGRTEFLTMLDPSYYRHRWAVVILQKTGNIKHIFFSFL